MGNFFEKNSCLEKKDSAADAEENRENARSCRQKVLYAAGLAGGLYAVLRYLLPLVAPFVFAFFIVRILLPGREKAADSQRHPDGRIFAAFDRNPCGWILFSAVKGNCMGGKNRK